MRGDKIEEERLFGLIKDVVAGNEIPAQALSEAKVQAMPDLKVFLKDIESINPAMNVDILNQLRNLKAVPKTEKQLEWQSEYGHDYSLGNYATADDFLEKRRVSSWGGYGGERAYVGERPLRDILDHEAPAAARGILSIVNLRKAMDDHGHQNKPLMVVQIMRLGGMYPYFSEELKKSLGVFEWAPGDPVPDLEVWQNARIILFKIPMSSEIPVADFIFPWLYSVWDMSHLMESPVLVLDHSKAEEGISGWQQSMIKEAKHKQVPVWIISTPQEAMGRGEQGAGMVLYNVANDSNGQRKLSWFDDTDLIVDPEIPFKVSLGDPQSPTIVKARTLILDYFHRATMRELQKIDPQVALREHLTNPAMNTHEHEGGINLNPAQMSMQVRHEGDDFRFNFNGATMDAAQVTGINVDIRSITPVNNLAAILGLKQ